MILFSERTILILIAEGKEPPAIAYALVMSLDAVYASIRNIEQKTISKTWDDLVELGKAFAADQSGNNAQGMQEMIDFYHDLDESHPKQNIIDYFDYE
jgi:DNA-binding CsgD family transcriptional regulator